MKGHFTSKIYSSEIFRMIFRIIQNGSTENWTMFPFALDLLTQHRALMKWVRLPEMVWNPAELKTATVKVTALCLFLAARSFPVFLTTFHPQIEIINAVSLFGHLASINISENVLIIWRCLRWRWSHNSLNMEVLEFHVKWNILKSVLVLSI